jgi:peptidoglycan/xylan/chitin deacetylase (PgdA/CDA1 family)
MNNAVVYLMYHEIKLPARPTADADAGYLRYIVTADAFRAQLAHLRANNFRGLSVAQALAENSATAMKNSAASSASDQTSQPRVVLTFDDGCETDLLAAAPALKEAGYNATFYVTAGHIGRRGYLSAAQLRELSAQAFDIGCHSLTHSLLTDLSEERLHAEIVEAKARLEDLTGCRVANFSCPGGRWNRRVADVAREAGYDSVATSRIGANDAATDRFCLSRVAVMRATGLEEFARYCRGEGLWKRRALDGVLAFAKKALGNAAYQKFRSNILGRSEEQAGSL